MATTKMSDPVRHVVTGEVTTLATLADAGRLTFSAIEVEGPKRNGLRTVSTRYYADLADLSGEWAGREIGWQISRAAYLSRTGRATEIVAGTESAFDRWKRDASPR